MSLCTSWPRSVAQYNCTRLQEGPALDLHLHQKGVSTVLQRFVAFISCRCTAQLFHQTLLAVHHMYPLQIYIVDTRVDREQQANSISSSLHPMLHC